MVGIVINVIKAFLGTTCTLITLMQFFAGTEDYKELQQEYDLPNKLPKECFIIILTIYFVLVVAYIIWRYKRDSEKKIQAANQMHGFHHDVRDKVFEMRKMNQESSNHGSHEMFYGHLKGMCEPLCELVREFMKELVGKDFSVCIKMLNTEFVDQPSNIDEAMVYTLCRAGKKKDVRERNERMLLRGQPRINGQRCVEVKGNSDFYSILSNQECDLKTTAFACSNLGMWRILSRILRGVVYKNTTPRYWKYYKSTVVAPIRIESEYLCGETEVEMYRTIAFLCVDYVKPISMALKDEIAGYVKSFADSFYDLFNEVIIMDRKILAQEDKIKGMVE